MKIISKIIISCFAVFCFILISIFSQKHVPIKAEVKDQLTVVTYNIHLGFDNTGRVDPGKILAAIQKMNPDIIGLQETETNRLIAGNYDITLWLAKKLNMYYYYGPPTKKLIYGVSILSKHPMKESKTIYLKSVQDQRVLLETTIDFNGKNIKTYVTHLGLSLEDRYHQTKWIYDNKIKNAKSPMILMGDFNTFDWEDFTEVKKPADLDDGFYSNRMKIYESMAKEDNKKKISELAKNENYKGMSDYRNLLNETWKIKNPNDQKSFTWFDTNEILGVPKKDLFPSVRIDYIFTSKDFEILESKIINNWETRKASDHLPVVAIIKIK